MYEVNNFRPAQLTLKVKASEYSIEEILFEARKLLNPAEATSKIHRDYMTLPSAYLNFTSIFTSRLKMVSRGWSFEKIPRGDTLITIPSQKLE